MGRLIICKIMTLARPCVTLTFHREEKYIPPKRPYSFLAMLDDILEFAAQTLVENGRLSFWMPTANDEDQEIKTPEHPCLEITSVCTQAFNRCKYCLGIFLSTILTFSRVKKTHYISQNSRFRSQGSSCS
mgnify:CR=1 FL=1